MRRHPFKSVSLTLLIIFTCVFIAPHLANSTNIRFYLLWKGFFKKGGELYTSFKAPYDELSAPVKCGDFIVGVSRGGIIKGININSWKEFSVKVEYNPSSLRTFCLKNRFVIFGTEDGEIVIFDVKGRRIAEANRVSPYLIRNLLLKGDRVLVKDARGSFYTVRIFIDEENLKLKRELVVKSEETQLPGRVVEKRTNPLRACDGLAGFALDGRGYIIDLEKGLSVEASVPEKGIKDVLCFNRGNEKKNMWLFLTSHKPQIYMLSMSAKSLPRRTELIPLYSASGKESLAYPYFIKCQGGSGGESVMISNGHIFAVYWNHGGVKVKPLFKFGQPLSTYINTASCYTKNNFPYTVIFAVHGEKSIRFVNLLKKISLTYQAGAEVKALPYFINADEFVILDLSPSLLILKTTPPHGRGGDVIE